MKVKEVERLINSRRRRRAYLMRTIPSAKELLVVVLGKIYFGTAKSDIP